MVLRACQLSTDSNLCHIHRLYPISSFLIVKADTAATVMNLSVLMHEAAAKAIADNSLIYNMYTQFPLYLVYLLQHKVSPFE